MSKSLKVLGCVCVALLFSSCQCAWAPDVGPVEDEEDAALEWTAPPRFPHA